MESLLKELGFDGQYATPSLNQLNVVDSRFLRDLKLNVANVLNGTNINKKESWLLALAVAVNEKNTKLIETFTVKASEAGASDAELAETHACVGLMVTNNVFYRFRHFMSDIAFYEKTPAGLRMSAMMNPVLGKEFFELMSLAISAVNGCERCVTSHEASVKQHGATEARIYDAVRLASVIRAVCVLV